MMLILDLLSNFRSMSATDFGVRRRLHVNTLEDVLSH